MALSRQAELQEIARQWSLAVSLLAPACCMCSCCFCGLAMACTRIKPSNSWKILHSPSALQDAQQCLSNMRFPLCFSQPFMPAASSPTKATHRVPKAYLPSVWHMVSMPRHKLPYQSVDTTAIQLKPSIMLKLQTVYLAFV